MIKDWIKNRLTPEKQKSPLWVDFANSLQSVIEETVDPILERISNRKSLFTMHSDDLNKRMAELGQFFIIRTEKEKSKPVLLAQRLDEIHFKGTDRPISATFWREFKNLPAKWEALYAPIDQKKHPYGTFFTTQDGVEAAKPDYGEFFLTSRGIIRLSLNDLYEQNGYDDQAELIKQLTEQFDQVIKPLLPLHIVFDGFSLYIDFTINEDTDTLTLNKVSVIANARYAINDHASAITKFASLVSTDNQTISPEIRTLDTSIMRFDMNPIDAWALDLDIIPPIIPTGMAVDHRYKVNAGVPTIKTEGRYGCIVSHAGGVYRYSFPAWADEVMLPIPPAYVPTISKITYCILPDFLFYRTEFNDLSEVVETPSINSSNRNNHIFNDNRDTMMSALRSHIESVVTDRSRSPDIQRLTFDQTSIDSWALDINTLSPAIYPGDQRLQGSKQQITIDSCDQRGCLIFYSDGSINRYTFPIDAKNVSIPYDGTHNYEDITKISFT